MRSKMKVYVIGALSLLLVPLFSDGAIFPGASTVTVCGVQFNTPDLIVLRCQAATSGHNCTFRRPSNVSSGYLPSGSKSYHARAWSSLDGSEAVTTGVLWSGLAYEHNDVGQDSTTSFMNPFSWMGGAQAFSAIGTRNITAGTQQCGQLDFVIPNGYYMGATLGANAATELDVFGTEE